MSIIDDDSELDRILKTTNFDNYKLIDISMESDESLHELTGIGMASASDTPSTTRLAPREGSSRELRPGVDTRQGSSLSSPLHTNVRVRTCVPTFLQEQSRKFERQKFYADVPSGHLTKTYTPQKFPLYGISINNLKDFSFLACIYTCVELLWLFLYLFGLFSFTSSTVSGFVVFVVLLLSIVAYVAR